MLYVLACDLNVSTPGKDVGAIGQCLTGGFALAAVVDDSVLAPVPSKLSLPIPPTTTSRSDLGRSPSTLTIVADRCANEGLCVMGLRFGDAFKVIGDRTLAPRATWLHQDGAFGA